MKREFKVSDIDQGTRLDTFLSENLDDITRSYLKKLIESELVTVNNKPVKSSYKIKKNDKISVTIEPPKELSIEAQDIPLDIIFEDKDIVVVNKSADMVVHPAAGNPDGTLVNALLHHCNDLSGIAGELRPGIVHRLDKGTSGVIVVAKNDKAHLSLSEQFKKRETNKIYYALVYGNPKDNSGTIDADIGRHPTDRKKMSTLAKRSRNAISHWRCLERFSKHFSLIEVKIVTGRTHQIRVHLSSIGLPIIGDALYGGKKINKRVVDDQFRAIASKADRPMLHALSISLNHPSTSKQVTFKADLPDDFSSILEELREISS